MSKAQRKNKLRTIGIVGIILSVILLSILIYYSIKGDDINISNFRFLYFVLLCVAGISTTFICVEPYESTKNKDENAPN